MTACVPVLRHEIETIRDAGANTVQLDEPWLSTLVDRSFREKEGITDVQSEIDLCVDLVNQTVDGIDGIDTAMHLCHSHFDRQHGSEGPYDLIMPALAKIHVGTISLEYATPVAGSTASLAGFRDDIRLGFGCIDHCDRRVENPDDVIRRVESALQFVEKERITLHPDCGFSPSVQNPMDLDEAYLKLKVMCEAAELLRSRLS